MGNQYQMEVGGQEIVEQYFSDTSKPMGVATYRTSKDLPQQIREALPDMDELKKLIRYNNSTLTP